MPFVECSTESRAALSPEAKWPAQRTAVLDSYQWLLNQGASASKIVVAGDSAGGNLHALFLMHLRDHARDVPLPACTVLMSPWTDMTAAETSHSPNFDNDFMFNYNAGTQIMNDTLRPTNLPYDTPEISAVLATDLGRLPSQLIMYSPTELLASDSERWVKRSRQAGVDTTVYAKPGELHTFALGWPMCGRKGSDVSDEIFLRFILQHVRRR